MSQSLRLKDQPVSERPRERLVAKGADALSHAELIAILLRTGLKGTNAVEVGKQLLQKFDTLQALARASVDDLRSVKGIGRDKAVTLMAAFALARKMAEELQRESPCSTILKTWCGSCARKIWRKVSRRSRCFC